MVVTKHGSAFLRTFLLCLLTSIFSTATLAATLSEERADLMFHSYEGGGITISGPSLLVRKNIKEKVSIYGNYYVDQISSASIDVITSGASEYKEERTEYSLGAEYLYDKSSLSLSGTQSTENDYEAKTLSFDVSQEFFGDMTTVSIGYSQGNDIVRRTNDDEFEEEAQHHKYRLSISQVLSPKWMVGLSYESISDQGFLNNPYRSVRFISPTAEDPEAIDSKFEQYPNTRNSDAAAIRSIYYLPYRASIRGELRTFSDNWGIEASNIELRYLHPFEKEWLFQASVRTYSQTQANFFSDLFSYENSEQAFMARDKEMSAFDSVSFGLAVFYEVQQKWWSAIDRTTISFQFDHMAFDYKNFRDASLSMGDAPQYKPGEEPFYDLKANVFRFFVSAYY